MEKRYNKCTSILFQPEIKLWLYRKAQAENRTLGNLVNTILIQEMKREENAALLNMNAYTKEEKEAVEDRLYKSTGI